MEIIIRPIEERDYPDVLALWKDEIGIANLTAESMGETYEKMARDDRYNTFVALLGSTVAGFITTVEVMAVGYPVGYMKINGLAVKKAFQGKGVGRKLIAHIEALARQRGISRIGLATGFQRKDAHAFYERLGYTSGSYWYGKNLK